MKLVIVLWLVMVMLLIGAVDAAVSHRWIGAAGFAGLSIGIGYTAFEAFMKAVNKH